MPGPYAWAVAERTPDLESLIAQTRDLPGGLLPALHAVQHRDGWIDPSCYPQLAEAFNVSVAEVHGVVSFYKDFRTSAPRGPVVQMCRAEACSARGADAVADALTLAVAGAAVEVDEVFCLGNCALGPTLRVGADLHGRVTPDAVPALVDHAALAVARAVQLTAAASGAAVHVAAAEDAAA